MSDYQVDLTNCDTEPIHIPGEIQSHGFLLVINQQYIITYFSDNLYSYVPGITDQLLGQTINYFEGFINASYQPEFISTILKSVGIAEEFERSNPVPVEIVGRTFYLIVAVSGDQLMLEFEPAESDFRLDVQKTMGRAVADILKHKQVQKLLDHSAEQVQQIIKYDRVMIYQFMEDGHGVVMAEKKLETLEPWLGLHYPASDIPKQARELYKLNVTRLIADVHSKISKITTNSSEDSQLDLTNSQLRAVSPIHIQYLKNMGVASSFSISIICNGELWGLIACHNYSPRFIDYRSREYAKLIGEILSSALEFREEEVNQHISLSLRDALDKQTKALQNCATVKEALQIDPLTLMNIGGATGLALVFDQNIIAFGVMPPTEALKKLIKWIGGNINSPIYHTTELSKIYPDAAQFQNMASGMLLCVLSEDPKKLIIWFKPERIHTVTWAGNPDKSMIPSESKLQSISPRESFKAWAETVNGVSEKWPEESLNAVSLLREEVSHTINLKAGALRLMNEKLQEAYQELESFSYSISHDLKNPIACIKIYAKLLTRDKTLAERGQMMLQRIEAQADQMHLMINGVLDYSKVGKSKPKREPIDMRSLISGIVQDMESIHQKRKLEITIGITPGLTGDRVMILQIFSNLISNAVKYTQGANPAVITISGETIADEVIYTVADNGLGIAENNIPKIFELFNRMDNVQHIEGSGVGLAIVKRIVDKHQGRIWVESELYIGSKFFIAFQNTV
ncbi:MAG: ATP-binding protein [Bacteroidota bacterium]